MKVKRLICFIMGVLAIEGGILIGISVMSSGSRVYGETEQYAGKSKIEAGKEKESRVRTEDTKAGEIFKENKQLLLLVNAAHELPEGYQASLRTICSGRLQAAKTLYPALVDMMEAAGREGHHYWIASAWRSREKQQKLIDEDGSIAEKRTGQYMAA